MCSGDPSNMYPFATWTVSSPLKVFDWQCPKFVCSFMQCPSSSHVSKASADLDAVSGWLRRLSVLSLAAQGPISRKAPGGTCKRFSAGSSQQLLLHLSSMWKLRGWFAELFVSQQCDHGCFDGEYFAVLFF